VDLPVCHAGGGALPGVDLDDSGEILDRMEGLDPAGRQRADLRRAHDSRDHERYRKRLELDTVVNGQEAQSRDAEMLQRRARFVRISPPACASRTRTT